eukprot:c2205_g1_i1.p1 GENE.c2205_g1_i1~~c2205_g1_i1.p1  ORF type:complete len:270 (-),score=74.86 c2205_g1_i1:279-1088(-)
MSGKFGLDKELAAKQQAKYDPHLEEQARAFICQRTGEKIAPGQQCLQVLKDGVVLCKLMNILKPGSIPRINTNKMAFMMMENIGNYLKACEAYGVRNSELFQTVDLYEEQNMNAVVINILAVARISGVVVQTSTSSTNAYEVAEKTYTPPPQSAPSAPGRAGTAPKASNDIPLMLAGAAKAGEAARQGAFTPGRRDINSHANANTGFKHEVDRRGSNTVPLLQAGMAAAGEAATKGAFGPGLRAEIVKTGQVDYGNKGGLCTKSLLIAW